MRNVNELIVEQLKEDDEMRKLHLKEAFETLFTSEYRAGLLMLRNIINATCGFPVIAQEIDANPKSVMKMLSGEGNPRTENIFAILHYLFEKEGLEVRLRDAA